MIPTVTALSSTVGIPDRAELSCGVGFSGNNDQEASQVFCCSEINNNRLVFKE